MNRKRVQRLYVEEKLSLRLKRRTKRAAAARVPLPVPAGPSQAWSIDFVWDWLRGGRRLKMMTVVDDFTRECLAIEVGFGLNGKQVTQVPDRLIETRGEAPGIRCDNGPEFAGNAMDGWAYGKGVQIDFIRPGKPNENAFIESFNCKSRTECLNDNQFLTLPEAQTVIVAWRRDYNDERPHSSLEGLTPSEFAERHGRMPDQDSLRKDQLTLA